MTNEENSSGLVLSLERERQGKGVSVDSAPPAREAGPGILRPEAAPSTYMTIKP